MNRSGKFAKTLQVEGCKVDSSLHRSTLCISPAAQTSILLCSGLYLSGLIAVACLAGNVVPAPAVIAWGHVSDLPRELEISRHVFWEPLDTTSLRKLISQKPQIVSGKSVLEIGTGSGLVAFCCRRAGAAKVVATDINPHALACAKRNSRRLNLDVEWRLVDSEDASAFAVVRPEERFDVIISNPPWEDETPAEWYDYALYDQNFKLLQSLLAGAQSHLNPDGKLFLAYGCVAAIRAVHRLAPDYGLEVYVLDERDYEMLPELFLPGMLLGLRVSSDHADR